MGSLMQYAAYETQPMVKWAQEVLRSGQRILELAEKMQNNGRDMQALSIDVISCHGQAVECFSSSHRDLASRVMQAVDDIDFFVRESYACQNGTRQMLRAVFLVGFYGYLVEGNRKALLRKCLWAKQLRRGMCSEEQVTYLHDPIERCGD